MFASYLTKRERENPFAVDLVGFGKCGVVKIVAMLNASRTLTVQNIGSYPVFILDKDNRLVTLDEVRAPTFGRITIFFLGVDPADDKPRRFQLTLDNQEDGVHVTLE